MDEIPPSGLKDIADRILGEFRKNINNDFFFLLQYNQEKLAPSISDSRSTVKCEHNIPGLGKFLAYTNGKIRIVFADRTALDMMHESFKDGSPVRCHGDGTSPQPKVRLPNLGPIP